MKGVTRMICAARYRRYLTAFGYFPLGAGRAVGRQSLLHAVGESNNTNEP